MLYENWRFIYKEDHKLSKDFSVGAELDVNPAVPTAANLSVPKTHTSSSPQNRVPGTGKQHRSKPRRANAGTTNKEASMNRMVDALVGDDECNDAFHDEDDFPVTPPTHAVTDTPMIRDLSNSVATLTASDFVNQVQNWSAKSVSASPGVSALNATASPFVASVSHQKEEAWLRPPFGSGPSSPNRSFGIHHDASPPVDSLQLHSAWHSRGPSGNAAPTGAYPPTADTSSRPPSSMGATPTLPSSFGDLRNVWGVSSAVPTAEWVRQRQPRYKETVTSSLLFGADGGPWTPEAQPTGANDLYSKTPSNGQGG